MSNHPPVAVHGQSASTEGEDDAHTMALRLKPDEFYAEFFNSDDWRDSPLSAYRAAWFKCIDELRLRGLLATPPAAIPAAPMMDERRQEALEAACFRWLMANRIVDNVGYLCLEYDTSRSAKDHENWAHWLAIDIASEMGEDAIALVQSSPAQSIEQEMALAEERDNLRRALEVIAVGASVDPVRDAGDELVALGFWDAKALEQHRATKAAPVQQEAVSESLDVCADPDNCSRCKTAPKHRGDLYHAGIPVGRSFGAKPREEKETPLRDRLVDLIASHLSGTYHCTRVWSAWHVGTMSEADFEDVGESDTPAELADAILAALQPTQGTKVGDAQ